MAERYIVRAGPAPFGHADPAVTLRIYSHVLREDVLGVGDIFAQAVKDSKSKGKEIPLLATFNI